MTATVKLLFGVHAHQPVGNFPSVLAETVERCYHPFLAALHRTPNFPFAIHISGWLLGYLLAHHQSSMELLAEMVNRGQAELVGAGDTEPVLAVIPHEDRVGQLEAMASRLEKAFGQRPVGAWLTERVWDSAVVPALVEAGTRYVMVDDYHFLCAGVDGKDLDGHYRTEEDGRAIDIFPISEALRYRLPFSQAEDAVAYLESLAKDGKCAAVYFDDIEKFGIWPETYQWVYEKGWLERFLEGVLASPLIEPLPYREYLARERPKGIAYLPTVSYIEMNEWTLPPIVARDYSALLHSQREAGHYDSRKALIRGGIWKNFFMRYPESNWMHKRMLGLSKRLRELPKRRRSAAMRDALYQAQANDAYWHGLFGGIYLPHLRRSVYQGIVRLERMLDGVAPRPQLGWRDCDLDGVEECFYRNEQMQLIIRADSGASVAEWDLYGLDHNLGDTLARREEAYYQKIREKAPEHAENGGSGIASAHDRVAYKSEILPGDLLPDPSPRYSFLDCFEGLSIAYRKSSTAADTPLFEAMDERLSVTKQFLLQEGRLEVVYEFRTNHDGLGGRFSTRLHLAMPSCDGLGGRLFAGDRLLGGFGMATAGKKAGLYLEDDVLGGRIHIRTYPAAQWQVHPHFTVSQSEAGFEKIMQALAMEFSWPLRAGRSRVRVTVEVIPHER